MEDYNGIMPNDSTDFFGFCNRYNNIEPSGQALQQELKIKLEQKVIRYRNLTYRSIIAKYGENLPSAIRCKNVEKTKIDWLKLEVGLRNNFNMVVGEDKQGDIVLLGYTNNYNTASSSGNFFVQDRLTQDNIVFIIPKEERLEEYKELQRHLNKDDGNFAVIRNKVINYISDFEVIKMYAEKLAEIQASRFSLAIQSKVMVFFKGEQDDETINQLIESFYNGAIVGKIDAFFDPKSQMYTVDNSNLSANMTELKTEYQNTVSELNTSIGINTTAVDKKSGVSPIEVSGNSAMVDLFGDGYLSGRNNGLHLINRKWELDLEARYNKEALDLIMSQMGGNKPNENND